ISHVFRKAIIMTDVAALGLRVTSDELPKAVDRLGQFVDAAKQAQSANDNLSKSTNRARDAKGRFASEAGRTAGATDKVSQAARNSEGAFARMASGITGVIGSFTRFVAIAG